MKLVHGGDVFGYAATHAGKLPLDFSANINPYGMPPRVQQALCDAVALCGHYPDPLCREARRAIGQVEGINPAWLFCGNGAADVLDRLAHVLRPRRALLTAPTFAEYERTLAGCDLQFHTLQAEQDFAVHEDILQDITPKIEAVYLCNPNNPTGRTIEPALLRRIAVHCHQNGIWLIVDECFGDFLTDAPAHTLKDLLSSQPRLILLRAYTKMFAMPGVRFGFAMSANAALVEALYRAGQPWNVSAFAQAAAVAAAGEREWAALTARRISTDRSFLQNSLQKQAFRVVSSQVNFVLFQSERQELERQTAQRGVLIRSCDNYRGLGNGYYRVAVRTPEETAALLAALSQ